MTTYITTKENFIRSAARLCDLIEPFDIDSSIATDKGVEARMFSDDDIVTMYGSADAMHDAMRFYRAAHDRRQVAKIAAEIRTIASVRFYGDVSIYDGYDADDADEIAEIVYSAHKNRINSDEDWYQ